MAELSSEELSLSDAVLRRVQETSAGAIPNEVRGLLFPWQQGFAARIFSQSSSHSFLTPSSLPPMPKPLPSFRTPKVNGEAFRIIARKRAKKTWAQQGHASRDRAVGRWKLIVMTNLRASDVGRTLLREASLGETTENQDEQLRDILAPKATSTLAKRAGPLLKLIAFAQANDFEPLPLDEAVAYRFLASKQEVLAPSFAQQLIEAATFAQHVVGLDGAEAVAGSLRIRGLASKLMANKRPLKQMEPLSVSMIVALEETVLHSECLPDAVIAGQALFCLFARARWSDAQCVASLEVDGPKDSEYYLQASVWRTKTSSLTGHKHQFLPMVAFGIGLENDWGRTWLEKRKEAGLEFGEYKPALPILLTSGEFGNAAMGPGEASRWLREILLQKGFGNMGLKVIGTHSLKATLLSWCAKNGVPREQRQILGYHAIPGVKSMLHYSRDEQAGPLCTLEQVIEQVKSGEFDPGATRSGRLITKLKPSVHGTSTPSSREMADSDSSSSRCSSASASSTSGSSSSRAADLVARQQEGHRRPASGSVDVYLKHRKLHTIHKAKAGDDSKLACGRLLTSSYSYMDDVPKLFPRCGVCFGKDLQDECESEETLAEGEDDVPSLCEHEP